MKAFLLASVLFVCAISCASIWDVAPALENRTLRISPDHPGQLEYAYNVCVSHFLGSCTEQKQTKDYYDLNDEATRAKLIAMGFVARVREKP